MLKIALTGNIGSGKTAAEKYFATLGAGIIDADKIAYTLTQKNSLAYKKILHHFGKDILLASGELNRPKLRAMIFSDKKAKLWLENLLHPLIYKTMLAAIKKDKKSPFLVLVLPLLFETKEKRFRALADRTLAITAPRSLCLARAKKRDQSNLSLLKKMLAAQLPPAKLRALADDAINNNGSLTELHEKIKKMYADYTISH